MTNDIPHLEKIDTGRNCPVCGARLYAQKAYGGIEMLMMCSCELEKREAEREEAARRQFKLKVNELRKKSLIPPAQRNKTFDNFYPRKGTKGIFAAAKKYADDFPNIEKGLLFIGPYGSGKTHLATAVANAVLDKGYSVRWITAKEIYDKVRDALNSRSGSENEVLQPYKNCRLLIIDDMGTAPQTEYSKSIFHSIIDYRMNYLRYTVMTSNLNVNELADRLDGRTLDRIPEAFETYTWSVPSYRRKENRAEQQDASSLSL